MVGDGDGVRGDDEEFGVVFEMVVAQDAAFDSEIAYCVEGKGCQSCEGDGGNVSVGCEIEAVDEGDEKDEKEDCGGYYRVGSGDCSPSLRHAFRSRTLYCLLRNCYR